MIDLIYNFIYNILIGENTTIQGADTLAVLLTFASIVLIFFVLVKLVIWVFNLGAGRWRIRK